MIPGVAVVAFIAWASVMMLMIAVPRSSGDRLGHSDNCADAETSRWAQGFLDFARHKSNELLVRAEAQRQLRKFVSRRDRRIW
jgi:hypothetical protein